MMCCPNDGRPNNRLVWTVDRCRRDVSVKVGERDSVAAGSLTRRLAIA
jgi:hypothetical protein